MALLCILIIGVFLQGIHGLKYFIYPIELLEVVNDRNEVQSKEKKTESRGGTDVAHAHGEEINENNAAQAEELNKKNVQLVEKLFFGKNAEQVDTKKNYVRMSEEAETKEFNGKNAEQLEFKEDNVTNNIFLRKADDPRIHAIMNFMRGHMRSTHYFYSEVKRIQEKGVVYDSLRKIAAYLVENPDYKESTLECYHIAKITSPESVPTWEHKPNKLIIDVIKDWHD